MPVRSGELLTGTLELMVLRALSLEPMHGWGLAQRIERLSRDVFQVSQGSLYPALQRMKRREWVRSEWRVTSNNRRARYYRLTASGRRQLEREKASWERSSQAVNWGVQHVLSFVQQPARRRKQLISDVLFQAQARVQQRKVPGQPSKNTVRA